MIKHIAIGAVLAAGLVQADVANVVNQAQIAGGSRADENSCSSGNFDIKNGQKEYSIYAVMKVDLSAIGAGETISAATFTMKFKNATTDDLGDHPGTVQLLGVVDSAAHGWNWNTDMTWNEAAAKGMWTPTFSLATAGLFDPKLVDLGSMALSGTGFPYEYDFTSSDENLINLINADTDGMLTLFVAFDANSNVGVRAPLTTATIEYAVITEPTSLGLITS